MGGSSSKSYGSVSTSVGSFSTTREQEQQITVLSKLFDELLKKNNLMNLSQVLSSTEGDCKDLVVVLSSQLEKEFHSIRFPDPSNPARFLNTYFLPKDQFDKMRSNDRTTKEVCTMIAEFLIRFVVLIGALTASITTAQADFSQLRRMISPAEYPVVTDTIQFYNISDYTIQLLTESGFLSKLSDQIYRISGSDLYLNRAGYIYTSDSRTKILGVKIGTSDKTSRPQQSTSQYMMPGYESRGNSMQSKLTRLTSPELSTTPTTVQQERPRNTYSPTMPGRPFQPYRSDRNTSSVTANTNDNNNIDRFEMIRSISDERGKYRGGVYPESEMTIQSIQSTNTKPKILVIQFFKVIEPATTQPSSSYGYMDRFSQPSSDQKFLMEFMMDLQGHSWSKQYYTDSEGDVDIRQAKPFKEFVIDAMKRLVEMKPTKMVRSEIESMTSEYEPNQNVLRSIPLSKQYEQLVALKEKIDQKKEILAPAAYRALLLATAFPSESSGGLLTSFCSEQWSLIPLTSIPIYAMLEALYDPADVKSLPEKAAVIQKFTGDGLIVPYNTNATATSFSKVQFPRISNNLIVTFCEKTDKITYSAPQKQILQSAFQKLQLAYFKHLQDVIQIIQGLVTPESLKSLLSPTSVDGSPTIQLQRTFLMHPYGARIALDEKIKQARNLISTHCYSVEKIYRDALREFEAVALGSPAPASS